MNRKTALTVPYYFVRTPLAIFDKTVVRWLPERSGPRRAYEKTTAVIDTVAGRAPGGGTSSGGVVQGPATDVTAPGTGATDRPIPAPASAGRPSTTGPEKASAKTTSADASGAAAGDDAPAKKAASKQVAAKKAAAKKAARKAAPKPDTRANRSLSRIALDLAETEAIAEARETQAEQRVDAELSGDPGSRETGNDSPQDNS